MQRDTVIKSRSLGQSSDLTLLAPLRPGLVDALETVTFKSRTQRVLDVLHGVRQLSHEFALARWVADAVERVEVIQSVRVAILEPQDSVLLSVSFDGSFESYIRVLWARVGSLLDLIFCNTVGYVTAREHSFDQWQAWVRSVQIETGFFYGPPDFTARDMLFQRRLERMRQRGVVDDIQELRAVLPSAGQMAERVGDAPLFADDPAIVAPHPGAAGLDLARSGVQGVATLYRLTDLYPPTTSDGPILRHAALDLLKEFVQLRDTVTIRAALKTAADGRFPRQIAWLFPDADRPLQQPRPLPAPPDRQPPLGAADRQDIQGGILRTYDGTVHGVVALLAFDGPHAVMALLDWLGREDRRLVRDDDSHEAAQAPGGAFRNLAFTLGGLRAAGLDEDSLAEFPDEFRQGMARRCSLLGDIHNNHPRRWRRPRPVDPLTLKDRPEGAVDMDSVHAVLQWRCGPKGDHSEPALDQAAHPLHAQLRDFVSALQPQGVRLLAVQTMRRRLGPADRPGAPPPVVDHFGYADGSGQPEIGSGGAARNRVHVGEIVLGHDNAADFGWRSAAGERPLTGVQAWLFNGSFLVMRKYREFPHRLEQVVEQAAGQMHDPGTKEDQELVYAKLMGRQRNGEPLLPYQGDINNFHYDEDPQGRQCPLHAHVRRAHPRPEAPEAGTRPPRIMRRGMSYGPAHETGRADDDQDRGLVFMAYNASLGEQFEVVQRWLVGGNSTGSSSGTACPIVGVPTPGLVRHFRFELPTQAGAKVVRVALEQPQGSPLDEPAVFTRLEWGLYLFAPSLHALQRLRAVASHAAARAPAQSVSWELARGRQLLQGLLQLQASASKEQAVAAWKAALQDIQAVDRLDAAALWAAIRHDHDGLLSTPYGHLVANRHRLHEVLSDPHQRYSVCGQMERMEDSFGPCYLGMDEGAAYHSQSRAVNDAIMALTASDAYRIAFHAATVKLEDLVTQARGQAAKAGDRRFQLTFEAREVFDEVLAALCEAWYGLGDDPGGRFKRGPVDWHWTPGEAPLYPGHFHALSRHLFQPHPGPLVAATSQRYGQALRGAMAAFVQDHLSRDTLPKAGAGSVGDAPLASATIRALATPGATDHELAARTMVGVLMGFIPTIAGALANVLHEWMREHRFEQLRRHQSELGSFAAAEAVLGPALVEASRMRPMPQVIWRIARETHVIGHGPAALQVKAGEQVVLGLVSGIQESLADGQDDGRLMFGGERCPARHSATAVVPAPLHACPGFDAARGAMLGALAALLARPESLRPDAMPLSFRIEGLSRIDAAPAIATTASKP